MNDSRGPYSGPNPSNPVDPMYVKIDTQPTSAHPNSPDSSPSHFTVRQFTPEDISTSNPILVTKTAHGLRNGQSIRATMFYRTPPIYATGMEQLNNRLFYVGSAMEDTFELVDKDGVGIDGSDFTAYSQGGQFTVTGENLQIVNPTDFPPRGIPGWPPL